MSNIETDLAALQKAIKSLEEQWSPEEVAALKRVVARQRAIEALGYFSGGVTRIITSIGFFIGAWVAFKAGLLEWLKNSL